MEAVKELVEEQVEDLITNEVTHQVTELSIVMFDDQAAMTTSTIKQELATGNIYKEALKEHFLNFKIKYMELVPADWKPTIELKIETLHTKCEEASRNAATVKD
jgi:hypothetical protein